MLQIGDKVKVTFNEKTRFGIIKSIYGAGDRFQGYVIQINETNYITIDNEDIALKVVKIEKVGDN